MITSTLIFGFIFVFIALMFLGAMFFIYLGRRSYMGGTIPLLFIATIVCLLIAGTCFSSHFNEVNKQVLLNAVERQELMEKIIQ